MVLPVPYEPSDWGASKRFQQNHSMWEQPCFQTQSALFSLDIFILVVSAQQNETTESPVTSFGQAYAAHGLFQPAKVACFLFV